MSFEPNWVSVPGTTISAALKDRGLDIVDLARKANWSINTVNELISGELAIDEDIAFSLQNILGSTKQFWLSRQKNYEERLLKIEAEKKNWLEQLPINDMIRMGWIKKTTKVLDECLNFFDVPNVYVWRKKYETKVISYRKTEAFDSNIASIATWIRKAEIQVENYSVKEWNKRLFESVLEEKIKPLTRSKNPAIFIPRLVEVCANCGVYLAMVPCIGKSRASGASMITSDNKALITLSFRHMSDDHFWFTFFHEAGHLIMHEGRLRLEDVEGSIQKEEEELEANLFASECLVPLYLKKELTQLKRNKRSIIDFAQKVNVSPGIIIGQLQHLGIIRYEYLNSYKRYYSWDDINLGINNVILN